MIGADASTSPLTAGGGSAGVNSSGTITPLQGITAAAPSGVTVSYNSGSSDSSAAALAASSSVAVVFAGNDESEGSDLSSIDLSSANNSLIAAVAAANPHTIVVLNSGSAVTMPWLSSVGRRAGGLVPRPGGRHGHRARCCSGRPTRPATCR